MKKIGIVTLNGNMNYGNRLQNFALQEVLKKENFLVDTIWFTSLLSYLKINLKRLVFKLKKYERNNNFMKFTSEFINVKYFFNNRIDDKYDFFVVGSDQVWNPYFSDFSENMLLGFSNKKNNISYAASFGINEIPNDYIDIFKNKLKNFSNISVRETQGAKIIKELINKDVPVVLDPTMLLTADEWNVLSNKPSDLNNKKYILMYFLGNIESNISNIIYEFAKNNNCEIINILDKKSKYYCCGPREFLYLEKNAFLICTDSFHSSVFGIIFKTPFIVFERQDSEEKMNSRLETLLNNFELNERKFRKEINITVINTVDLEKAQKILNIEKENSIKYLKSSLKVKDSD